jgi:tRNA (guanine-N7-)-methyltransferase
MARALADGGAVRFATDIADYAAWTLLRLIRSPAFAWTAARADDWRQPWPGFTRTRYEAKAERAERAPCYLIFRRIDDTAARTESASLLHGGAPRA